MFVYNFFPRVYAATGPAALWQYGTVKLWHCGIGVIWHRGTVLPWHGLPHLRRQILDEVDLSEFARG